MVMQEIKIEPLFQITPQGLELKFIPVFDDIPPEKPHDFWIRENLPDAKPPEEEEQKNPH